MKKALLLLLLFFLSGCAGAKYLENPATGKKERVEPYGIFNMNSHKRSDVVYDISAGTVISSIILCETIIVPVLGVGYQLYEPVYFTNSKEKYEF